MIEIKVTNPQTCDKPSLIFLSKLFADMATLAGDNKIEVSGSAFPDGTSVRYNPNNANTAAPIHKDDSPATGAPTVSDAAHVFKSVPTIETPTPGNPAAVFTPVVEPAVVFLTQSPNVPQPPVSAAGAVASVPASNTNPVLVDADGLPYDARIHSGGRTQNADGRWKKKRGLDDAYVAGIEAELRGVMAIPSPVAMPVPPTPAPMPTFAGVPVPPAPVISAPVPLAVTETAAPDVAPVTFASVVGKITSAVASNKVTQAQVAAMLAQAGIGSIPLLATRPDLVPSVNALVDNLLAS